MTGVDSSPFGRSHLHVLERHSPRSALIVSARSADIHHDGIPLGLGRDLVRRLVTQKKVLNADTVSHLAQLADERLKPAPPSRRVRV